MPTAISPGAVLALVLAGGAAAQSYFPPPPVPAGNPTTPDKVLLGKALFWDEQLSSSRTVACGTCHIFGAGGSDPRITALNPGPDGVFGNQDDIVGSPGVARQDATGALVGAPDFGGAVQVTGRRAPSPINAAYEDELFWDGRAGSVFYDPVSGAPLLGSAAALESQAAGPPTSDVEMSHVGRSWSEIAIDIEFQTPLALAENIPAPLQTFVSGKNYAQLFTQVYGTPGVTPARIVFAIAAYERTLISDQTPYDHYLAGTGTLTAQQSAGLAVFQQLCVSCHTDIQPSSHSNGPGLNDYRNIGVRPEAEDIGREAETNDPADRGKFKTPGLRNVELRAPLMHNGRFNGLGSTVDLYNRGGDHGTNIDPLVTAMAGQISSTMRSQLNSFMRALTDPRVAQELPPFDRPTLWSESARTPLVFGAGTAGTGGFAPQVVLPTPAFVGNGRFAVGLDDALPGAAHFLALALSGSTVPTPIAGQNLYLPLSASATFNGLTQSVAGTQPGTGFASSPLPIPANTGLTGLPLYGQWLVFDVQGPNGLSSSNAFGLTIF